MGCHTWVYKKFKACSKAKQKEFIKKKNSEFASDAFEPFEDFANGIKDCAKTYMDLYECQKGKDSQEYKDWEAYMQDKHIKELYEKNQKKYSPFGKKITADNILEYCKAFTDSASYGIHNNELYIYQDFDCPFRVYGYPEETFTDKNTLIEWLKENSQSVEYFDKAGNTIDGYTLELEELINKYFDKNGKENLYFEFG